MVFWKVPSVLFSNIFLAVRKIKIIRCVIGPGLSRQDDVF